MASLDTDLILAKARTWLSLDTFDSNTVNEVKSLIEAGKLDELADRFHQELSFGTGGMRGIMGVGTSRINAYNLRKASAALAEYLVAENAEKKLLQVAICHDSRHNSRQFAKDCAEVFAGYGIKVLLFDEMRPVSFLSFLIRDRKAQAGVFITASHNPPKYNGFKVYWQDGAQIVPPHDHAVTANYQAMQSYHAKRISFDEAVAKGLVEGIGTELDQRYLQACQPFSLSKGQKSNFKIVYTPLHGTGIFAVPQILTSFGFSEPLVPALQKKPDGNFPSVKSPNPEDPEAMTIALALAKEEDADLILATDPDADRIGLIAREAKDSFRFLNGNELAALLCDYLLKKLSAAQKMPKAPYLVKTIVTTDLIAKIAKSYGAACYDTLTGFKWIAALIEEKKQNAPEETFICGGEESFGFLAGDQVRDKDAVLSCAIASEMFFSFKEMGISCTEVLDQLYSKHGFHLEELLSFTFEGAKGIQKIAKIMDDFRQNCQKSLCGYAVHSCQDYLKADTGFESSDVLAFSLESGLKMTVRPSGTEPKVKMYLSLVRSGPFVGADLVKVKQEAEASMREFAARVREFVES